MLVQMPRDAECLRLPKVQSINTAWKYLQSIAGHEWVRRQFTWLASPLPTYLRNGERKTMRAPRVGTIRNGKCLAYLTFPQGCFTVHYSEKQKREFHAGFAGMNAGKYRTPDADEPYLIIRQWRVKQVDGMQKLCRINYEIFVEL